MRRLTKAQKAKNRKSYAIIRKAYEQAKLRMTPEQKSRITYIGFKHRVQATMRSNDVGVKEASRKVLNSEAFTSPAERSRANLKGAVKDSFKEAYERMRKLSRDERGRFKRIEENLSWDKERKAYVLGGRYLIDVTNSPEEINIIDLYE